MTIYDILLDIHALEEEMLSFERKYGIRKETFYVAYANGEEPELEKFRPFALPREAWLQQIGTQLAKNPESKT